MTEKRADVFVTFFTIIFYDNVYVPTSQHMLCRSEDSLLLVLSFRHVGLGQIQIGKLASPSTEAALSLARDFLILLSDIVGRLYWNLPWVPGHAH